MTPGTLRSYVCWKRWARRLYISNKTVSNHISNIFAKLHMSDRAQAIVTAREAGLGRGGGRR